MAAIDITAPDGTYLADIIANLNSFATLPTTSRGGGEIIHYSGDNTIRWNSQTTNPTTNPIWSDLGAAGVTDHGALTGLTDDDHTQYMLVNGSRSLTGDLTFNKSAPSIIFDTNDSLDYDKTSNAFDFIIGGSSKLYLSATDLIAKTNIAFLKTDPVLQFDSNDYFKYVNASNALQLFIASTLEYEFTASTLDLKNNSLNNANIAGTNATTFKINQDNVGAEASAIEFDRGSEATAARIHWSEANDRFTFEEVTGSTLAEVRTKQLDVQDQINLDDTVGTVMIKKNDSTGDMELQVAAGDSIVFKAV